LRCSGCGKYLTLFAVHNREITCPKCNAVVKCYKDLEKDNTKLALREVCLFFGGIIFSAIIGLIGNVTFLVLSALVLIYLWWRNANIECRVIKPAETVGKDK